MNANLQQIVAAALKEDMPEGDLTTDSLGIKNHLGRARLVAKEDLVFSGAPLFELCVTSLDPDTQLSWKFKEGDYVLKGQTLCLLKGNLVQLLKSERTALNFLGHLSGIATYTRCYTELIKDLPCQLLDTRKTTPLYRSLEKQAVRHGLGTNHRLNLSQAVLIKENHIRLAGGIEEAIQKIRRHFHGAIEVECSNLDEVKKAVDLRVESILLDNMTPLQLSEALQLIPKQIRTEASGNINLDNLRSYAETGVQFISVGKITHSAPCADMSLLFEW